MQVEWEKCPPLYHRFRQRNHSTFLFISQTQPSDRSFEDWPIDRCDCSLKPTLSLLVVSADYTRSCCCRPSPPAVILSSLVRLPPSRQRGPRPKPIVFIYLRQGRLLLLDKQQYVSKWCHPIAAWSAVRLYPKKEEGTVEVSTSTWRNGSLLVSTYPRRFINKGTNHLRTKEDKERVLIACLPLVVLVEHLPELVVCGWSLLIDRVKGSFIFALTWQTQIEVVTFSEAGRVFCSQNAISGCPIGNTPHRAIQLDFIWYKPYTLRMFLLDKRDCHIAVVLPYWPTYSPRRCEVKQFTGVLIFGSGFYLKKAS